MNIAGRIQPPAQLANLLFKNRNGNAGGRFDGREHLTLRQRFQSGLDDLTQQGPEDIEIGRLSEGSDSSLEIRRQHVCRRRVSLGRSYG